MLLTTRLDCPVGLLLAEMGLGWCGTGLRRVSAPVAVERWAVGSQAHGSSAAERTGGVRHGGQEDGGSPSCIVVALAQSECLVSSISFRPNRGRRRDSTIASA